MDRNEFYRLCDEFQRMLHARGVIEMCSARRSSLYDDDAEFSIKVRFRDKKEDPQPDAVVDNDTPK